VYLKAKFGGVTDKKSVTLTDPLALEIFGVMPTISGASVTPATALRVPSVYSAIALIAGAIGSLPAKVFISGPSGKRTANDHPAYRLVHREANDWTSAGELRARLTADALLYNQGGFAYANRVNGRVVEFIRLDPASVTVKADAATGEPVYEVRDGNRVRVYPYTDILHIRAPLDLAPINAGREAIALATVLEQHAARLFAGGARPSSVIEKDNKFAGSDGGVGAIGNIKKMYRAWRSNESTEPLILDDGLKYKTVSMTSTDAQFLEMRLEQVREIARVFRVPPHLLFELSRATWSNAEEMFQSFLTLTLRSWLDAWEWAYARVLLSPEEREAGTYVEFVVDDLLTANAATRATVYAQFRSMGAMTANEVRAGLNLAPLPDGNTLSNPNITPGSPDNDNAPVKEAA
jgi:HK97 family phage portal protein